MWNKRRGMIVIAAVSLLLILSLVYYYSTNLQPKMLYLQAEKKNYDQLAASWQAKFGPELQLHRMLKERPAQTRTEIAGNFQFKGIVGGFINQQLSGLQSALAQMKLTIDTNQNPQEEKFFSNLIWSVKDSPFLEAELYQAAGETAVRLPDLYPRYFLFENDQFGPDIRKVEPGYRGPEQIADLSYYLNYLGISTELSESIQKAYELIDQLQDVPFQLEKVSYQTPQGEKKAKQISYSLTGEEVQRLYQEVLLPYADQFPFRIDDLTFPAGLQMKVLLDQEGLIVDRDLRFQLGRQGQTERREVVYTSKRWTSAAGEESLSWKIELSPTTAVGGGTGSRSILVLQAEQREQTVAEGLQTKTNASLQWLSGKQEDNATQQENKAIHQEDNAIHLEMHTLRHQQQGEQPITETTFTIIPNASLLHNLPFIQIPRLHGQLYQQLKQNPEKNIEQNLEQNDVQKAIQKDIRLDLQVDMESNWLGKQSAGVELNMKTTTRFTEVQIPQLAENEVLPIGSIQLGEWQKLKSQLEVSWNYVWAGVKRVLGLGS